MTFVRTLSPPPACDSEQAGAVALGYTKLSWDDETGQARQPLASFKSWAQLTANERAGAVLLGYTQASWDNVFESQPATAFKSWDELLVCGEGERRFVSCLPRMLPPISVFHAHNAAIASDDGGDFGLMDANIRY